MYIGMHYFSDNYDSDASIFFNLLQLLRFSWEMRDAPLKQWRLDAKFWKGGF